MARAIHKLTARGVETQKRSGRYGDGAGLYLRVTSTGNKRWVFRYTPTKGAQPREMGLGSASGSGVSLAEARERAQQARQALKDGLDPIVQLRVGSGGENPAIPMFGDFADQFVADQSVSFRNEKHIAQWRMTLTKYAAPIRQKRLNEITTDDVLFILKPIWQEKHETASRLRGRIERVLNAAKARGFRSGENPAAWRGHLELLLPKQAKLQRGHFAAMSYSSVPAFMTSLRERSGMASLALEFTILCACRSGEVRRMTWDELDRNKGIWTIPATKMKAGRPHRVPLTDRMGAILDTVEPWGADSPFVFPSRKGTVLSDAAMNAILKRMNISNVTVHGFRSSFRDWAGDMTDHAREVAEAALAHVVGDATEQAYRRSDAFDKRRQLMSQWERYLAANT